MAKQTVGEVAEQIVDAILAELKHWKLLTMEGLTESEQDDLRGILVEIAIRRGEKW
jgi:hypothetical protein